MNYPHTFTPITVGQVTFKNRIITSPASPQNLLTREYPTEAVIAYYREKARGGSAAVAVSSVLIDSHLPHDPVHQKLSIENPAYARDWRSLTSQVHFFDAKVSMEFMSFYIHGPDEDGRIVRFSPSGAHDEETGEWCPAIPPDQMDRIADEYATAAESALAIGFDGIVIHGAHGLFLHRMMSPITNTRKDEYGGPMQNRARFALKILDRIRERVGRRLYIEYRVSGSELRPGGYEIDDCIEFLRLIEERIDIAHISAGIYHDEGAKPHIVHPTVFVEPGHNTYLAAAVKRSGLRIPVATIGGFQEPELIEETIASGSADLVSMARGTIADPDLPNKALLGKPAEIIPCIKCLYCWDYTRNTEFGCAVNPTVGREAALPALAIPTVRPKRVVVIGGGPAGMQAALVASDRGHDVTLIERNPRLGGQLIAARVAPFKVDLGRFMDYLVDSVGARPIELLLETDATPDLVGSLQPDVVIAAVGSRPALPPIKGIERTIPVLSYYDDRGLAEKGKVVVIGGGLAGSETAVMLGMEGRAVSLVGRSPEVGANEPWINHVALLEKMDEYVDYHTNARCTEVTSAGVTYVRDGEVAVVAGEHVILAAGTVAAEEEAEAFRGTAPIFRRVGDCLTAGDVRNATRTAFDAAASY